MSPNPLHRADIPKAASRLWDHLSCRTLGPTRSDCLHTVKRTIKTPSAAVMYNPVSQATVAASGAFYTAA